MVGLLTMENKRSVRSCCVAGCSQATKTLLGEGGLSNISFHSFPRQKENQVKWVEALQKHNGLAWTPTKYSTVCSIHFGEYCWEKLRVDGKRKLKWNAVPLHFKPPPEQPVTPKRQTYNFDHPYCSGVFVKRKPMLDISNVMPCDHSYSTKNIVNLPINNTPKKQPESPEISNVMNLRNDYYSLDAVPKASSLGCLNNLHLLAETAITSAETLLRTPDCLQHTRHAELNDPSSVTSTVSCPSQTIPVASRGIADTAEPTDVWSPTLDDELNVLGNASSLELTTATPNRIITADTDNHTDKSIASAQVSTRALDRVEDSPQTEFNNASSPTSIPAISIVASTGPVVSPSLLAELLSVKSDLLNTAQVDAQDERRKDIELAAAKEENRRLKERLEALTRLADNLNKQNVRLRATNAVVTRKNVVLMNKCKNMQSNLSSVFNEDQIEAISRRSTRGLEWQPSTIKSALTLKMQCGTTGYDELRKKFPYPSVRTLQRHVQHIVFESGIIDEVFDMLLASVRNMKEEELECVMAMDEMAIDPSERLDPSTDQPIGRVTLASHSGLANKALVFILGGISTRWKQTVAYHFTRCRKEGEDSNSYGKEIAEIIREIIRRTEEVGLRVDCVTSDMGPDNRAIWRQFGIDCGFNYCTYSIPHPIRPNDKLCFIADVPHLFKSQKKALVTNNVIYLPDYIVHKYNLPTNVVSASHLKNLFDEDNKFELKAAPRLTEESLKPQHFETMRVGNARAVVCQRTATGLQLLALQTQNPSYITTAWFVKHINRWFDLMSSRCPQLALSKAKDDKYKAALDHLEETIQLFNGMRIGEKGGWKPVQTSVMATNSILYLQKYLLNERGFKFVLTSRFTQDFLENLFSSVRARQSIPHALAFKNILKVVTIAQYCRKAPGSSYDYDEGNYLSDFLAFTKAKRKERAAASSSPTEASLTPADIPRVSDADVDNFFSVWEKYVLYDMCGAALTSTGKVFKVCDTCVAACLHTGEEPHSYSVITQLNTYSPDALKEVSDECYRALAKAEVVFRSARHTLMSTKDVNVQEVLLSSLNEYVWCGSRIPPCHDITTKLLKRYLGMRWATYGRQVSAKARKANKKAYHGSKSVAMHTLVR